MHKELHRNAANPMETWNNMTILKWKKELNLTEAQQERLESTLDDFAKYYENVLADGKDRILSILNDDQRRKFEHMLQQKRKP